MVKVKYIEIWYLKTQFSVQKNRVDIDTHHEDIDGAHRYAPEDIDGAHRYAQEDIDIYIPILLEKSDFHILFDWRLL